MGASREGAALFRWAHERLAPNGPLPHHPAVHQHHGHPEVVLGEEAQVEVDVAHFRLDTQRQQQR